MPVERTRAPVASPYTLENSTFSDNVATCQGSSYYCPKKGGGNGGAVVAITATVTISNSTFRGNHAEQGDCIDTVVGGGAIASFWSNVNIDGSTLNGNDAVGTGGAVAITESSLVTMTNSTLSGNRTIIPSEVFPPTGGGVAIFSGEDPTDKSIVNIRNSTITGNIAAEGGGLAGRCGSLNVASSIIAGNKTGDDCWLSEIVDFSSLGYNLASDGTCNLTASSDISNTNPLLGSLANNGGPTWTHALLPGSQAIDHIPRGTNDCGTEIGTDQRGVPRPLGSRCDIGTYELVEPGISVAKTVGFGSGLCASESALDVDKGAEVHYCISIRNTGNITMTNYTVNDPKLGISSNRMSMLAPGAVQSLTNTSLPALGPVAVTGDFTNTVTVAASNGTLASLGVASTSTATSIAAATPVSVTVHVTAVGSELVATRTVTVTVYKMSSGERLPGRSVGFKVTGGTVVAPEFHTTTVDGEAYFKYVSRAPQLRTTQAHPANERASAAAPSAPLAMDTITIWVDSNGDGYWEVGEPFYAFELPTAITLVSFTAQPNADGTVTLVDNRGRDRQRRVQPAPRHKPGWTVHEDQRPAHPGPGHGMGCQLQLSGSPARPGHLLLQAGRCGLQRRRHVS